MINLYQTISLVILAPLFFPVFSFCPFRLPYIYCYICPLGCIWGKIRGLVLLIVLGLNLRQELFCSNICPFGTLQRLLFKIIPLKITVPRALRSLKYLSVVVIIFVILITAAPQPMTYRLMGLSLSQIFVTKMKGLLWGIFLLSMAMGIFSYRFFCYNLCPIKALSKLLNPILGKAAGPGSSGKN